ncbi:dihydrodipicolinate reductase [Ruegeria sediminis]|uniref:Dihydrodipicolinate reductase n=1 Tax=Ruegeria sediminis TaxID=2583820 RepID=A0ABY2X575_9RHOB|nr:dihydrodipicolinate reductase [Ruegeria sediminis]TMV10238.1 dihydrodipicolinate reductase [Ruegeria sediminis]
MKPKLLVLLSLTAAVAGSAALAEFKQVKKESQFQQQIVDRKLVGANGDWTIIKADGSQSGEFNGNKYVGSWKWSGKYWCRNGVIGGRELGTNCQLVEVDGNSVRFIRDKGKGKVSVALTIE